MTVTIRRKRVHQTPIHPDKLRFLQELEALHYGHSLGGAFRAKRNGYTR